MCFQYKITDRLKVNEWKKKYHKNDGVAILISDRINFRIRNFVRGILSGVKRDIL